jgi:molybdenum cofactor biosynthesis protein B
MADADTPTDRTPTHDPSRRTTDEDDHDIVSPLQVAILTVSTSRATAAAEGEAPADPGGDTAEALFERDGHRVVERALVRDGIGPIQRALDRLLDDPTVDLVLATGGTGPTVDDVTPQAAAERFDRELPGFGELFRQLSFEEIGPRTVASRATGGIARDTPVFVVPGSSNAVELAVEAIVLEEAPHLVGLATRHRE